MPDDRVLYMIRPTSESSISLEIFRRGLLSRKKHVLFFESYGGELEYDAKEPHNSRFTLRIDTESAVCRDAWLKPEKRKRVVLETKSEMLSVGQFPQIIFSSGAIQRNARHRFEVTGTLTIHGDAKAVTLSTALIMVGQNRIELDASGSVELTGYGLKVPPSLAGLWGVKPDAGLRLLLFPERAPASQA